MNVQLLAVGARPWDYIVGHWGISFLVNRQILFDTFASFRALQKKLTQFQIDMQQIQTVVISHEHWDHIGGLWELLEHRKGLDVYLPTHATPETKLRVMESGSRVIDDNGEKMISPDIYISAEIMGGFKAGTVAEQSLVIKSERGLVIIAGCAHPGILDIVEKAKQVFGLPVYAVLGGFHLMHSGMNEVRSCAKGLTEAGVTVVAPTHCTGWRAEREFKAVFKENFISLKEGQLLQF